MVHFLIHCNYDTHYLKEQIIQLFDILTFYYDEVFYYFWEVVFQGKLSPFF